MKNTLKILGIIAMVALIGFSMVSCSDDAAGGGGGSDSALNGKWVGDDASGTLEITADAWTGTGGSAEGIALVVNAYLLQNTVKTQPGFDSFKIAGGKMTLKMSMMGVSAESILYTYKIDGKTLTINTCDDDGTNEKVEFKGEKQ